jgi:hypothetical protein
MRSLAVHPTNANELWLGTEANGIVHGVYSGGSYTWTRQRSGLRYCGDSYSEIYDIAISSSDPQTLLAVTNYGQNVLNAATEETNPGGVYWSTDGGETWERKNTGIAQGSVAAAAFLPGSTTHAWVATQSGSGGVDGSFVSGVMYSTTNSGSSWTEVPGTLMSDSGKSLFLKILLRGASAPFQFFAYGVNVLNLPASPGLLLASGSAGVSFSSASGNAAARSLYVSGFDVAADGSAVYLSSSGGKYHRSTNNGASWDTFTVGADGVLAVSPANANVVIVGGTGPGAKIYRSVNALAGSPTFSEVFTTASQLPHGHVDDIVFAPSNSNVVYLATKGYLVYRSEDGGATWSLPANGNVRTWLNENP